MVGGVAVREDRIGGCKDTFALPRVIAAAVTQGQDEDAGSDSSEEVIIPTSSGNSSLHPLRNSPKINRKNNPKSMSACHPGPPQQEEGAVDV